MSNIIKSKKGMYVLPGICSFFFPGLGQLLKGHWLKAVVFWIAVPLVGFLFKWIPLIGGLIAGLAWLINLIDAAFSDKSGTES